MKLICGRNRDFFPESSDVGTTILDQKEEKTLSIESVNILTIQPSYKYYTLRASYNWQIVDKNKKRKARLKVKKKKQNKINSLDTSFPYILNTQ